jgi:hypothetical protein
MGGGGEMIIGAGWGGGEGGGGLGFIHVGKTEEENVGYVRLL